MANNVFLKNGFYFRNGPRRSLILVNISLIKMFLLLFCIVVTSSKQQVNSFPLAETKL